MFNLRKGLIGSAVFLAFILLNSPVRATTLKESVELALKQNPAVIASSKKVNAASARLSQAVGAFMPTVKLDGNLNRTYSSPQTVQITTQTTSGAYTTTMRFGINDPQNIQGIQASLSQPVFVAALFPGYGIAKKGADLAKQDFQRVSIETVYNVTQAYFGVIRADRGLKLAIESLDTAKSHQAQVQSMLNAGVATKADLLRAEVQVANFEVGVTKARNSLDLAKDAYNNALGNDLETPISLQETGFTGKVNNLPNYAKLKEVAFANRPDWQEFLLQTGISKDTLHLAQTDYLPTVMLSAASGSQRTENPVYNSDVSNWNVVGAASWKLFDGLSRENKVKEAAANLSAQYATEDQLKNNIALEVRDAFLNLRCALDTIGSSQKAVDSAIESYKVSDMRFASGAGTNLEVIDAQTSLNSARFDLLQALFDVEIAKAKVNKVVGKEVI
jgi:outer membrane protein TolC